MIRLLIIFMLAVQFTAAQVKTGVYQQTDSMLIAKKPIASNSLLTINSDRTFTYNNNSPGPGLSYTAKGAWAVRSGKLYLTDSTPARSNYNDSITLLRVTVFKIHKERLDYFNAYYDGDKFGFFPVNVITGHFMYKQD